MVSRLTLNQVTKVRFLLPELAPTDLIMPTCPIVPTAFDLTPHRAQGLASQARSQMESPPQAACRIARSCTSGAVSPKCQAHLSPIMCQRTAALIKKSAPYLFPYDRSCIRKPIRRTWRRNEV